MFLTFSNHNELAIKSGARVNRKGLILDFITVNMHGTRFYILASLPLRRLDMIIHQPGNNVLRLGRNLNAGQAAKRLFSFGNG